MQTLMIINEEVSVLQQTLETLILEFLILVTLICFRWLSAGKWQRTEDCFQESEAAGETTEPGRRGRKGASQLRFELQLQRFQEGWCFWVTHFISFYAKAKINKTLSQDFFFKNAFIKIFFHFHYI